MPLDSNCVKEIYAETENRTNMPVDASLRDEKGKKRKTYKKYNRN